MRQTNLGSQIPRSGLASRANFTPTGSFEPKFLSVPCTRCICGGQLANNAKEFADFADHGSLDLLGGADVIAELAQ